MQIELSGLAGIQCRYLEGKSSCCSFEYSAHRSTRAYCFASHHRYSDDEYEYRHVQLPKNMLKVIPRDYFDGSRGTLKLLWEDEWRGLGITQSLGWEHYEVHEPEPHILLFK